MQLLLRKDHDGFHDPCECRRPGEAVAALRDRASANDERQRLRRGMPRMDGAELTCRSSQKGCTGVAGARHAYLAAALQLGSDKVLAVSNYSIGLPPKLASALARIVRRKDLTLQVEEPVLTYIGPC